MKKIDKTKIFLEATVAIAIALAFIIPGAAETADMKTPFENPVENLGGGRSWSDNFDSYVLGQFLDGTPDDGGWKGWDNDTAWGAYVVNDQSYSSPHSVDVVGATDLVHEYVGYTSGQWTYTAWQYVPEDFQGESYFILLSDYIDGAGQTNKWAVQLRFDSAFGIVESEHGGPNLPLIKGRWVELVILIDLDADWMEIIYDGNLLEAKAWTATPNNDFSGFLVIDAVDLFANSATSVYYDDMSLEEGIPLLCNADGPYEAVIFEDIQFDGSVSGGVPPYTYDWDFGNGDHAYVEDPVYNYSAPGVYTVWFNVTDSGMDFASDFTTATITEPEPLVADAHGPYDGLVGEVIHFSGSATGGIPPYTWDWDFGDGNTSDEQNPDYAYSEADVFDVVLTVTDSTQTTDDDATTANITEDISTELEIGEITGGMGVKAVINNTGDNDATGVEWHIYVEGGFLGLIDVDANNTEDELEAGITVETGSLGFLHLGGLEIEVTAEAENADKVMKTATGFIIGPFVLITG